MKEGGIDNKAKREMAHEKDHGLHHGGQLSLVLWCVGSSHRWRPRGRSPESLN